MMMMIILIRMKILERWMRKGKRTHSSKRVLIREQILVREHILAREHTSSLGERARERWATAPKRGTSKAKVTCVPFGGGGLCVCPSLGWVVCVLLWAASAQIAKV